MTESRQGLASRVFRGSMVLVLTQAVVAILFFVAQRIILSTLTKEENGLLFVERRVADLLMVILVDMGLNGVAMRLVALRPEKARDIVSALLAVRLLLAGIAMAVVVAISYSYGYSVFGAVAWCGYLMISSRSALLRYALEIPVRSQVRYTITSAMSILDAVLFLAALSLWPVPLTADGIILAFLLSAVPGFLISFGIHGSSYVRPGSIRWTEMRMLLVQALPILASIILMNVHDKIDAMMVERYCGLAEAGIFGAAYSTVQPITSTLPIAVALALAPVIARLSVSDFEASKRYGAAALRFLFVMAVVISTSLASVTPMIIDVVTRGRYADNLWDFFAMMWMPVSIFVIVFIQEMNVAMSRQRYNMVVSAILCGSTVVSGLLLIPAMGAWGAVVSKLLTIGIAAIVAVLLFGRVFGQRLDLWIALRCIILIGIGVGIASVAVQSLSAPVAGSLGLLASGASAFALRFVTLDDVRLIRRLLAS